MCSMNTRKSIFFRRPPSEFNYMIQRALEATEKQEIDAGFDEAKEIYLFSELLARVQVTTVAAIWRPTQQTY